MAKAPAKKPAKAKKPGKAKAPRKADEAAVEALAEAFAGAVAKKAGGRPSKYRPAFVAQAKKLCLLGATDQEIADFFEVDVRTIHRWKGEHEEFCHALTVGKDEADSRVVRSLYQQAIGYEQDEVKIFMPAGAESPVYAPYRARVAPSAAAAIFWLKNRRREDWREKVDLEHSGSVGVKPMDASEAHLVAVALGEKPNG